MTEKKTYKNFKGGLKISKEYETVMPALTDAAFNALKENIERDGRIFDPLIIDENKVIIDGHNRYKIAEMLDMSISTTTKNIKSIDEGVVWIVDHQIGQRELALVQKAVIGLKLKAAFTKIGKERQSMGGTNKEKLTGGFKTSKELAKRVGVNETLIKAVIGVEKYLPNLLPLLGLDKISITDAVYLKRKNELGIIKKENVLKKGELSEEAKDLLNEYHNPMLSDEEIELRDSETKTRRLREKVEADNKKKAAKEKADAKKAAADKKAEEKIEADKAAADKAAADKAAAEANKGDIDPGDVDNSGGGGGNVNPIQDGLTEGNNAEKNLELLRLTNSIDLIRKNTEKDLFKNGVQFIDFLDSPEKMVPEFNLELSRGQKESGYPPNIVIAVPNKELNNTWIQSATLRGNLFCDSKEFPARFIYYGNETIAFYNRFKAIGLISASLNKAPESKMVEYAKASIETLEPPEDKLEAIKDTFKGGKDAPSRSQVAFSMARTGDKKPAKAKSKAKAKKG